MTTDAVDLREDDTLLSEALAEHVPDDGHATDPGVYALDIAVPDEGHESHARRWLTSGYGTVPPFLPQLVACDKAVYVGRSSNVRARLEDHLEGRVRTASLPSVYEIRGIDSVEWGENSDTAERQYADELAVQYGPDVYVHSR